MELGSAAIPPMVPWEDIGQVGKGGPLTPGKRRGHGLTGCINYLGSVWLPPTHRLTQGPLISRPLPLMWQVVFPGCEGVLRKRPASPKKQARTVLRFAFTIKATTRGVSPPPQTRKKCTLTTCPCTALDIRAIHVTPDRLAAKCKLLRASLEG